MSRLSDQQSLKPNLHVTHRGVQKQLVAAHNRLGGMITAGVASTGRAVFAG